MKNLKKRTIVITGGSSGIGMEIAKFLIKKNFNIINLDVKKQGYPGALFVRCNLENVKKLIAKKKFFERYNITSLINCAGLTITKNSTKYKYSDWQKTLSVNLTAPFFLSQMIANIMIRHRTKGSIVNITSISSEVAMPDNPAYNSSKAALKHLTKSLAVDLSKHHIRVNNISPGYTKSSMNRKSWNNLALRKKRSQRNLMNRWADTNEYNEAVLFLIDNNKSSYMTGSDLIIDGGWTIKGL